METYCIFFPFNRQLNEGNRNMAAAAQMVDLTPLPRRTTCQAGGFATQHRGMIEKVFFNGVVHLLHVRCSSIESWESFAARKARGIRAQGIGYEHLDFTLKLQYRVSEVWSMELNLNPGSPTHCL